MEILTTTGIALSSRVSGEADIMCNFFTRDFGKRKFIFKGLKKSRKRSRSATEPGSIATLVFYSREDRDAHIVNQFEVRKYHASISGDLSKIYHLFFMLELVDRTCGYENPDEGIYRLLLAGIDTLSRTGSPAHLSAFFLLHLLRGHGILPDYRTCTVCGKSDFAGFALDSTDLRPICGECLLLSRPGGRQRTALLQNAAREFIHACVSMKFSAIDVRRYPEPAVLDLLFSLTLFIESYFHTEIKSKSCLFAECSR